MPVVRPPPPPLFRRPGRLARPGLFARPFPPPPRRAAAPLWPGVPERPPWPALCVPAAARAMGGGSDGWMGLPPCPQLELLNR